MGRVQSKQLDVVGLSTKWIGNNMRTDPGSPMSPSSQRARQRGDGPEDASDASGGRRRPPEEVEGSGGGPWR
eukprot:5923605-Pyramimonas_sp.AAC.1